MRRTVPTALAVLLAALTVAGLVATEPTGIDVLRRQFVDPPPDARPMMRWWWFGPAVTSDGIARELRTMREGGIGGVEVQPVYPLSLDDERKGIRNLRYLSSEFLDALRFASRTARELGLRFDLTLGSGWPYGGPQVPIHEAAARLRVERVAVPAGATRAGLPALGAGESLMAAFVRMAGEGTTRELAPDAARDAAVWLPEAHGASREVLFFIATRTGQMVKRAAVGAEGFVLDHLDRAALDHYLERVGAPQLLALGADLPHAIFCDSLEAYGNDWTGDFLEQFAKRRGYDLKPLLPVLVDEKHSDAPAVRHDWALTLSELLDERFMTPLGEWARARSTRLRIQGYGSPPALLASNRHADLVDGEGSHWRELTASRWAASASHVFQRPEVASETWTWLHSPVFRATPLDVKAEADRHFLQGINQLIGHGWPYTPDGVEYPGWRFYAAGVFNERNPWWLVMPDISRYLQRLSFLLRQGRAVNDVAIYLPTHDALSRLAPGHVNLMPALSQRLGPVVIDQVLSAGFGFDFIDDGVVAGGRVEDGTLVVGDGRYRAVVLPNVEAMPAATLVKLDEFVRAGGLLLATRGAPKWVPGLRPTERDQHDLQAAATRLFAAADAKGRVVADEASLGSVLADAIAPDVVMVPQSPEVGFVHRQSPDVDLYFFANTSADRRSLTVTVRSDGRNAQWWDPLTGRTESASEARPREGAVSVALELAPYESRVLVLARGASGSGRARGTQKPRRSARDTVAVDLSGDWDVSFADGEAPVRMPVLRSWTDEERTRYFSGVATYERRFEVPARASGRPASYFLDFGEGARNDEPQPPRSTPGMAVPFDGPVREAAVVEVNGQGAGAVWCPPYRVDVTAFVRPGVNSLRIRVANLAVNAMSGRPPQDLRLLHLRYGERFQPQDMDKIRPLPSGLLGPVRLLEIR